MRWSGSIKMGQPPPIRIRSKITMRGFRPLGSFADLRMDSTRSISSDEVKSSNRFLLWPIGMAIKTLIFLAPKMSHPARCVACSVKHHRASSAEWLPVATLRPSGP